MNLRKISKVIIYVFFYEIRFILTAETFDHLICSIENELKPYQITTFYNQVYEPDRSLLRQLITRLPTTNVNLHESRGNRTFTLNVYKNPRAARILYLLFQDFANITEIENTLGTLVELASRPSRPKCMLVVFDSISPLESHFKQVFRYAWSLNFLEFVILQLSNTDKPEIISYDPFIDEITFQDWNSDSQLFPDKLHNVNHYPLKVPLKDLPPFFNVITNNATGQKEVKCTFCKPLDVFVEKINASYAYMTSNLSDVGAYLRGGLRHNNLSFALTPSLIGSSITMNKYIVPSKPFLTSGLVFVVPLTSYSKLNVSSDLLLNLAYAIVIVITFKMAAFFLKLSLRDWSFDEIIQLFLGVSLGRPQPSRLPDRIIYMTVAFLSMKISSDLLASFTDVRMLEIEVPFNSLDDIRESGLPVQMASIHASNLMNNSFIRELLPQIDIVDDILMSFEANRREKPTIFIAPKYVAIDFVSKYFDPEFKRPVMKIAEPLLVQDFSAYAFEVASPYVDRFNEVLIRLIEAGLTDYWFPKWRNERLGLQEMLVDESNISVVLFIVWVSGSLLAGLTFLAEMLYFRHHKSKRTRPRKPSLQLKMFSKKDNKCLINI